MPPLAKQKDIRVELKFRNNLILEEMERRGIPTVAQLCRDMGRMGDQVAIGCLINLKQPPIRLRQDGTWKWRPVALRLADHFGLPVDSLFSEATTEKRDKSTAVLKLNAEEVRGLIHGAAVRNALPQDEVMIAAELPAVCASTLKTLNAQEERVIRMRFGLDGEAATLKEIGKHFGVTTERIRQIESKALRKLRHPSRSALLEPYCYS